MTSHGYLYRMVTRHTDSLEVWPPATPRLGPHPAPDAPDAPPAPSSGPRPPVTPAIDSGSDEPDAKGSERGSRARARERGGNDDTTSGASDSTAKSRDRDSLDAFTTRDAGNPPVRDEGHDFVGLESELTRGTGDQQSFDAGSSRRYRPRAEHHRGDTTTRRARTIREPADADTVHVHIGRIEVRAVTVAAERAVVPPALPRGPQPLSLDDYLAGRSRR